MASNLITRNGQVVHAQRGNWGVPVCSANMATKGYTPVAFLAVDADKAPVTCKNCCRKLGLTAPKTLAVKAAPKAKRVELTATESDIEASRQAMVEWAEVEARFEGGTAMDHMHAAAIRMASFRKGGRR